MAYTTIDDPSAYFQSVLYTGNASTLNVVNDGNSNLQPDFVWLKSRSLTQPHTLRDSSRGTNKFLYSNTTGAEGTNTYLTAYNSDGFSMNSTDSEVNGSGATYVAWQWKANGGTRTTNTESGNNPAGGYQANTTAGFSIVDYVGTGATGTMAHGLGAVPQMIIYKDRSEAAAWIVYHHVNGNGKSVKLNTTDAVGTESTLFNDTTPTSSVFTVGSANNINKNDNNFIAYCFTPIQGYSKFGTYEGNGNADGRFVFLGFKPRWIITKGIDNSGRTWVIRDTARDGINPNTYDLYPDSNFGAEYTGGMGIDFLSNGFKMKGTSSTFNGSETYIYIAFAEHPFVSSKGVPTTAG